MERNPPILLMETPQFPFYNKYFQVKKFFFIRNFFLKKTPAFKPETFPVSHLTKCISFLLLLPLSSNS